MCDGIKPTTIIVEKKLNKKEKVIQTLDLIRKFALTAITVIVLNNAVVLGKVVKIVKEETKPEDKIEE